MLILKILSERRLKKKIRRARICREKLKQEIKPYDWMKFYE